MRTPDQTKCPLCGRRHLYGGNPDHIGSIGWSCDGLTYRSDRGVTTTLAKERKR